MGWTYMGARVVATPTADISPNFRGKDGWLIQQALDGLMDSEQLEGDEPWRRGEDPIFTLELAPEDDRIKTNVTSVALTEPRIWATHKHHTAKRPGDSPFVRWSGRWPMTDRLTIELSGTPDKPILARAYTGEYRPPLPWMGTASQTPDGGLQASIAYWRTHAYLYGDSLAGARKHVPPLWFSNPAAFLRGRTTRKKARR